MFFPKILSRLASFTLTQLTFTLASLPILVGWGMGISCMSIVGNLLFTPLLAVFLLLCSLLFFTELFHIPNSFIALCLEKFTAGWGYMLNLGSPTWLVSCARPHMIILLAIFVLTLYVLLSKRFAKKRERLLGITGILCCCVVFFSFFHMYKKIQPDRVRFNNKVYVIKPAHSSSIILIDTGYFSKKKSLAKCLECELRPWIAKHFGTVDIKELRLSGSKKSMHAVAKAFRDLWQVQNVRENFARVPKNL